MHWCRGRRSFLRQTPEIWRSHGKSWFQVTFLKSTFSNWADRSGTVVSNGLMPECDDDHLEERSRDKPSSPTSFFCVDMKRWRGKSVATNVSCDLSFDFCSLFQVTAKDTNTFFMLNHNQHILQKDILLHFSERDATNENQWLFNLNVASLTLLSS